ncbi:unnamed protein product [Ranitomeya imitator]|uniref:Uncharacterized protein n=1 Tax=Ranitomeya imitator TaxID=111125 RepID=A0ABN9M833_9NEOB|nr:unnamed protein product [Ranitomeya imitator]
MTFESAKSRSLTEKERVQNLEALFIRKLNDLPWQLPLTWLEQQASATLRFGIAAKLSNCLRCIVLFSAPGNKINGAIIKTMGRKFLALMF